MRADRRLAAALLGTLAALPLPAASFTFRADSMETVLAKGRERTLLSGNARVKTEDNEIRADTWSSPATTSSSSAAAVQCGW